MGNLNGKQIAIIVGQKNYNAEEYDYLIETFENEGAVVCTASNSLQKALARLEGYTTPDCKISDINVDEFDAIVIIGGYGSRVYLWDDKTTHEIIRQFARHGKLIAAISTAPIALANAGILDNKKVTIYPDYDSTVILEDLGVKYVHDNLVVDDNIITASHSKYVSKFAEALMDKLKG